MCSVWNRDFSTLDEIKSFCLADFAVLPTYEDGTTWNSRLAVLGTRLSLSLGSSLLACLDGTFTILRLNSHVFVVVVIINYWSSSS
jgi:hypothetical protein